MNILNKVFKKNKDNENNREELKVKKVNEGNIKNESNYKGKEVSQELYNSKIENKKVSKGEDKSREVSKVSMAYKILVKPLLTEKAAGFAKINKYIFEVSMNANKVEIKKAIRNIYGIMPIDVKILNIKGKKVGLMRRVNGKRKDRKKAIISLKQGETLNVYKDNKSK